MTENINISLYNTLFKDKIDDYNIYESFIADIEQNEKNKNKLNNFKSMFYSSRIKRDIIEKNNDKVTSIKDKDNVLKDLTNIRLTIDENINYSYIFEHMTKIRTLFLDFHYKSFISARRGYYNNKHDNTKISKIKKTLKSDKLKNLRNLFVNIHTRAYILNGLHPTNLNNKMKLIRYYFDDVRTGNLNFYYLPSSTTKFYCDKISNNETIAVTFPNSIKYIFYYDKKFIIPFNSVAVKCPFGMAFSSKKNKLAKLKVYISEKKETDIDIYRFNKKPFYNKTISIFETVVIGEYINIKLAKTIIYNIRLDQNKLHLKNVNDGNIILNTDGNVDISFSEPDNNINMLCINNKTRNNYLTLDLPKSVNYLEISNYQGVHFNRNIDSVVKILCGTFTISNKNINCDNNEREYDDVDFDINESMQKIIENAKIIINTLSKKYYNKVTKKRINYNYIDDNNNKYLLKNEVEKYY